MATVNVSATLLAPPKEITSKKTGEKFHVANLLVDGDVLELFAPATWAANLNGEVAKLQAGQPQPVTAQLSLYRNREGRTAVGLDGFEPAGK